MPIFHCARDEKRWRKSRVFISEKLQPDARPDAVQGGPAHPISSNRKQTRAQEGRGPARSVPRGTSAFGHAPRRAPRRAGASGRVRSREELSRLGPDTGCSASGQTVKRARSWQWLSDSHCYCLSYSDRTHPVTLTGASGHHVFSLRCLVTASCLPLRYK
jgi:hypothetical protein